VFIPDSLVIHDVGVNQGVNYGLMTDSSIWKFKYGARNETSFQRREEGLAGVVEFALRVQKQMRHGKMPWHYRRAIYKAMWDGYWFRPKIEMPRAGVR
jgi:hypothetical protein